MKRQLLIITIGLLLPSTCFAWGNGQSGNAATNEASECSAPPYSTHDWIADHAVTMLPDNEKAWILPHMTMYLLGTESPDNDDIPTECGAPNNGYDDRRRGHSVEWDENYSAFLNDRAATRAAEEYDKAVTAYDSGNLSAAAFYLGAMAHYIGDVSQYGHAVPFEDHHSDYESWVGRRTKSFDHGVFETYLEESSLVRRTPYTAVKRISKITAGGREPVMWATVMDSTYTDKKDNQEYLDSVGHSLNLGVNELADVLHRFYLNEVSN